METTLSTLAQVFVGPLVGTISDYYGPALLQKIGIKWDVTEEMEKLSVILLTIKVVLEDAEEKQVTNDLIRKWLRELKDVAYDVEDLLEVCATEALHDPESTGIINGAVKPAMVDRFKRFINKFCFPKKRKFITKFEDIKIIKQVIDKFEEIATQRSKFNLINLTSTTRVVHCRVDPRRETSSFPTELKLYGRDEEKECIVNLLVNNINAEDLSIYGIVGMGGLGKTTLAQMVYNDNMIKSRFEIKRWVCVSENFEVKSLIGDIIQSGSQNNSSQTLDQLQHRLQEILSGKRFLLVLDDVWNEDPKKWSILKSSLTCGAQGSSIVVTTRSNRVASLMDFSHKCEPKMLTEEDCFSLFKHHAFDEGEGEHHPNLESIGKEIVKKCGGVPLAAKALGGILCFLREDKEWLFVKESKLWDLPQDKEDSILPALLLSYKHLPQHLRQCFAYCSIFPKDYIMQKEVLIQLWMANGFLQPKGNMDLEDIGNGIFNDLLWRGFFQEVSIDDRGNTLCKMHDLVHDLACSITRDECFSVVTDEELVVRRHNTPRHLAIYHSILVSPNFSLSVIQSFLRTLFQLDAPKYYARDPPPPLNFSNLIYLRALDLSCTTSLETLPESIGELKLLRYLDLSHTGIALLSDEVFGNLINLQTLKLIQCDHLEMLPGNMKKFTNLRHLDISWSTENLVRMPAGMGQLKSLRKLSDFKVSDDRGVGELGELDHLEGSLQISCLWKVKDVRDAENAKLSRKENIRVLRLNWSKLGTITAKAKTNSMSDKLIADALQPHPNIKMLDFGRYCGSDFPRWMNSTCLFSLETLKLLDCLKCKQLPTLGLLPHLKKLFLGIHKAECIGNEFYCDEEDEEEGMVLFPALEELQLYDMWRLEKWKGWSSSRMNEGETQVFPVLKTLTIQYCSKLRTFLRWSSDPYCSVENLGALQTLNILKCTSLVSSPDGILKNLTSLKELTIEECDGLKSFNKGLQHLTNLHSLRIRDCPGLELLPDDFQNLVSLQSLHLDGLPWLAAVPVVGSSTLETIIFYRCVGLANFPEWITNQKSLRHLEITGCHPVLYRRCQKNTGEDWQKIAHIRYLQVGKHFIRSQEYM